MGRLPEFFAGKKVTYRIPYSSPGEIVVDNNTTGTPYPEATFLVSIDKPFEVHRAIFRVTPYTVNGTQQQPFSPVTLDLHPALPRLLEKYVRVKVRDTSKNEQLNKSAQILDDLVQSETRTWEYEEPYTLVRSEGFEVTVDNLAPATFTVSNAAGYYALDANQAPAPPGPTPQVALGGVAINPISETCTALRIETTFEGFLLVVAPASETR